jgi:hypothetical protein
MFYIQAGSELHGLAGIARLAAVALMTAADFLVEG